jgi:DNA uptake protein ComE-like DNA-binding protein
MFEKQIRGLIVTALILAIIPFIILSSDSLSNYKIPILADQVGNVLTVEIQNNDAGRGIYFSVSGITANQLLTLAGVEVKIDDDFLIGNGMKLQVDSERKISVMEIENSRKLALGMPIDLNRATEDDLLLIPGIGEITAHKILKLRSEKVRFTNIEELMEIQGIKGKRLSKFKNYVYLQE